MLVWWGKIFSRIAVTLPFVSRVYAMEVPAQHVRIALIVHSPSPLPGERERNSVMFAIDREIGIECQYGVRPTEISAFRAIHTSGGDIDLSRYSGAACS